MASVPGGLSSLVPSLYIIVISAICLSKSLQNTERMGSNHTNFFEGNKLPCTYEPRQCGADPDQLPELEHVLVLSPTRGNHFLQV